MTASAPRLRTCSQSTVDAVAKTVASSFLDELNREAADRARGTGNEDRLAAASAASRLEGLPGGKRRNR